MLGNGHQVSQFVNHDQDIGYGLFLVIRLPATAYRIIVRRDIPYFLVGEKAVAPFHLGTGVIKYTIGFFRVGHNGLEQMGNPIVNIEFHDFGVDHQHADIFWRRAVKNADKDGIDAHRLARTGCPRDQKMGHLSQITQDGLTAHITAQGCDKRTARLFELS